MSPAPLLASGVPTPRGYRTWIVIVQSLLVAGWAMYVLFLPAMMRTAGIAPKFAIFILILDQAIFAACDWAAGTYADRLSLRAQRLAPLLTVVALVSSVAMLAMPFLAKAGSPALFLAVIVVWTATSSALRAPVFAMLGRVSGIANKSGPVGWALVSLSVAGALMPIITARLTQIDPGLPLAVGALSLAAAALFASRVEARFPPPQATAADSAPRATTLALAFIVLLSAVGTQVHTALLSKPNWMRVAGPDADLWAPTFWIAFAIALPFAVRLAKRPKPLTHAAIALVAGGVILGAIPLTTSLPMIVVAQIAGGVAWGIATTIVISAAFALGGSAKAGTAAGMVFAALATAAVVRLALVALGVQAAPVLVWLPAIGWLAAGAILAARARDIQSLLVMQDVRAIRAS